MVAYPGPFLIYFDWSAKSSLEGGFMAHFPHESWRVVWNTGQREMLQEGPERVYIERPRDDFVSHLFMRLKPGTEIEDATLEIFIDRRTSRRPKPP
jgi:hypothetical protein